MKWYSFLNLEIICRVIFDNIHKYMVLKSTPLHKPEKWVASLSLWHLTDPALLRLSSQVALPVTFRQVAIGSHPYYFSYFLTLILPSDSSHAFPSILRHMEEQPFSNKSHHVPSVLKNLSGTPRPQNLEQTPYVVPKVLHDRNPACLCVLSHPIAHPPFSPLNSTLPDLAPATPYFFPLFVMAMQSLASNLHTLCFLCSNTFLPIFAFRFQLVSCLKVNWTSLCPMQS